MDAAPLLLDSITDADAQAQGRVVICGSHGGLYPGAIASRAGVRAVVFNDAGIGLDRAGVAGVLALADIGMAAAAVDCQTARIGSASDTIARGVISMVNVVAHSLGVKPGMSAQAAAQILATAPDPQGVLPPANEARQQVTLSGHVVHCLDSASLVGPQDAGKIVITGSHGALIGGDPARAIKAPVRVVVFNDAGIGVDQIGVTRLPALDARQIAAVTVSCQTARIGDACSALESGIISCTNRTSQALGAVQNGRLSDWLTSLSC
ncbi:MAG: hypothetical protein L3J36_05550 [Rhodobacteraceae bacterium]|nr:hypothetical protein [Paracoccaceae bacterium]